MEVTVKVKNADEIVRRLRTAVPKVRTAANRVIYEQANAIRDDAKSRVPVDKGELKKSIEAKMLKGGLGAIVGAGGRGKHDPYYAYFVEVGTQAHSAGQRTKTGRVQKHTSDGGGMPAQPYLFPAARSHEAATWTRLQAVIERAIEKAVMQR